MGYKLEKNFKISSKYLITDQRFRSIGSILWVHHPPMPIHLLILGHRVGPINDGVDQRADQQIGNVQNNGPNENADADI